MDVGGIPGEKDTTALVLHLALVDGKPESQKGSCKWIFPGPRSLTRDCTSSSVGSAWPAFAGYEYTYKLCSSVRNAACE
jgi:hypothetical protein